MWLDSGKTPFDSEIVAAVNAYYYLTGKSIPDSKYEELLDISGAKFNKPDMEVVWNELGIMVDEKVLIRSPVDLTLWRYYEGLTFKRSIGLTLINLGLIRTANTGMGEQYRFITPKQLMEILVPNQDEEEPRWNVRNFKLR